VRQLADWGANVIKIDAILEDAAVTVEGWVYAELSGRWR
jgi:crotonobetainyl-CoA:carnitine CoA-transferase CaiB-like acyl-CoA transferase